MRKKQRWLGKKTGVKIVPGNKPFKKMDGNNSSVKIILHDEGAEPGMDNAVKVMKYTIGKDSEYHCTWDSKRGKWCQSTPFHKASRALLDGDVGCDTAGTVCIQVCVVGFNGRDSKPFTSGPMKGAWVLAEIADAWGVPLEKALGDFKKPTRSKVKWRGKGVGGHNMAPGNDHGDPGGIDFPKLVKEARRQQKVRRKRA